MLFQQFVLKPVLFQQFVLGPVKITDYMLDIRLIDEGAILPEEEENSPSQAAEAAFSNLSRKKTMHLLKRARRNAQVEKERAAAVVTSGRLQPLDGGAILPNSSITIVPINVRHHDTLHVDADS